MPSRFPLLLVDDEQGILLVLSTLLEDMGCSVTRASSGKEALRLYEALQPPVVITDIKMPGMDGIALLREIKARNDHTEVIMLTGHGDMEFAVESLRNGAGDFLSKPVTEAALEVALERAGQRIALRETLRRHTEELEKLVEQRTRELIESERFAAVGETAAGLSHAIKNIAGALEGTMYVLEKGLELNRREYFEQGWRMVRADVSRLRSLAMELLDLGSPAALRYLPIDPDQPAREVADLVQPRLRQGNVTLELDLKAGPDPVTLAAEAVHQCLLNLVLNAVEACSAPEIPAGRRQVLLRAEQERLPEGTRVIMYTVMDDGPGFSPLHAPAAIPRFYSDKEGGSGIGLFATRKLAREMGADLRISSRPGCGATAILTVREKPCGSFSSRPA